MGPLQTAGRTPGVSEPTKEKPLLEKCVGAEQQTEVWCEHRYGVWKHSSCWGEGGR